MDRRNPRLKMRERIYRWFFVAGDRYKVIILLLQGFFRFFLVTALLMFTLCFLYYIGFNYSIQTGEGLVSAFRLLFFILFLSKYIPDILSFKKGKNISLLFRALVFVFTLAVFLVNFNIISHEKPLWGIFQGNTSIILAIFLIGAAEMSGSLKIISTVKIHPALILSSSFLVIIFIGSGLLLLPKAHLGQLSYLDSLFTSVSAVCVTGLTVVDTAATFTTLGKIIIMCLIQIGGLGIMTFTGFFSYIFTSSESSFRDRLLLKEIFSSESLNNLFSLLVKIILLTFLTEIAGTLIIYAGLDLQVKNKVMFSIFHAVSAFCNAGFSTLTDGLFSSDIRYDNSVQISVAVLVILGGIGFPVLVSLYSSASHAIVKLIKKVARNRMSANPEKKNISTRVVLITTLILLVSGTGFYYFFESDFSLSEMSVTQKIITSFFGSVSARTAGFNVADISLWSYPTVFLMITLMWIGASPGSTGGGIKTTTFALAIRSVWNSLRGRDQLKIGNREIGSSTVTRVLSIIFLSLILITTGFFCLLISEPGKNPVFLLFECVSAFSTVGLSLAGTGTFSEAGKITVIFLMFIGRVGPLTLFTGLMLSHRKRYSRYPELDIIIN